MSRSFHTMLRRRDGYLVIEIMAALLLSSIALGSLVPVLVTTVRSVDLGRHATAAANLGQDKIEQIRNTAFAALANGSDSVTQTDMVTAYARSWTVTPGPTGTTKKVTVTVSWTDRTSQQVTLQTIVGQ
jgi:Tfp pilus assembly protein PilV